MKPAFGNRPHDPSPSRAGGFGGRIGSLDAPTDRRCRVDGRGSGRGYCVPGVAGGAHRRHAAGRRDSRSGAAQYSGTPSSVFEARLEQAYKLYKRGVAPQIITVGGKQEGDEYTEAASGKMYLTDRGIPSSAITAVETGSDTLLSIDAVSAEMSSQGINSAVLVSDPWHSLRTRTMARDTGLQAWTAPTRQGPAVFTRESQLHGIARETGALLWYQLTHFSADFPYTAGQ